MNVTTPSGVEITFDEDAHKYLVDGSRFPSVTTLLGVVDKSGPLMSWCETTTLEGVEELLAQGRQIPAGELKDALRAANLTYRDRRDTAATRGTSVHDALEKLATDGTPPSLADFPSEDRGFVQALCSWWIRYQPEALMVEQIVASTRLRFAGKFDLLARIDGRVHLCDLKSSKRIYNTHFAQVAGYALALEECGWDAPDVCSVVRVGEDGEYDFVESSATAEDFEAIAEMYEVLKRLNRKPKSLKVAA